jgi:hypothetical protein
MTVTTYNDINRERQRGSISKALSHWCKEREKEKKRASSSNKKETLVPAVANVRPKIFMATYIHHIINRDTEHTKAVESTSIFTHKGEGGEAARY